MHVALNHAELGSIPRRPTITKSMKHCCFCKEEKTLEEFNKNSSKKDGLQSHCKKCTAIKAKEFYKKNKKKHIETITVRKKKTVVENQQLIMKFLSNSFCVDCGEKDPLVLEFDHKDRSQKTKELSAMIKSGTSWKTITLEIKKCEIRCANCHNRKTHIENNSYRIKWMRKSGYN